MTKASIAPPRSTSPFDVTLGARIKAARLDRGMNQVDLASAIGVSFQQVQKYERGKNRISVSTFVSIAKVLGLSAGALLIELVGEGTTSKVLDSGVEKALARLSMRQMQLVLKVVDELPEDAP